MNFKIVTLLVLVCLAQLTVASSFRRLQINPANGKPMECGYNGFPCPCENTPETPNDCDCWTCIVQINEGLCSWICDD